MSVSTSSSGKECTIQLPKRFDFSVQSSFRKAYENAAPSSHFIVDFYNAEYMDSSALGMLLLLREYAGGDLAQITLKNCCADIINILEISNFQKLFAID